MLRFDDFYSEITSNYYGTLFDPISEIFIHINDVDNEVYRDYIKSGEYVELPIFNSTFRRELYEKFVTEYILVHYDTF